MGFALFTHVVQQEVKKVAFYIKSDGPFESGHKMN